MCAHFINLDSSNHCLKFCFVWYKICFRPEIFCHYFHSKECFPLILLHINTNPHAPTLNFLSVRLFLCHTVRNSRGRTMSKQLSNWTLLGNSPSSLYNDSGLWPARRRVTNTLTNISKISIHSHQGSCYTTTYISACCPTQPTPNALWAQGALFTTKSMFCAKNRQQQCILWCNFNLITCPEWAIKVIFHKACWCWRGTKSQPNVTQLSQRED